jgi:hypothetical protein
VVAAAASARYDVFFQCIEIAEINGYPIEPEIEGDLRLVALSPYLFHRSHLLSLKVGQ